MASAHSKANSFGLQPNLAQLAIAHLHLDRSRKRSPSADYSIGLCSGARTGTTFLSGTAAFGAGVLGEFPAARGAEIGPLTTSGTCVTTAGSCDGVAQPPAATANSSIKERATRMRAVHRAEQDLSVEKKRPQRACVSSRLQKLDPFSSPSPRDGLVPIW